MAPRCLFSVRALAILVILAAAGFAQTAPEKGQAPINAESGFLLSQGRCRGLRHRVNVHRRALGNASGAYFLASRIFPARFAWQSKTFPYTLVEENRSPAAAPQVPHPDQSYSLFFEEFVEENGAHIVLDPAPVLPRVENRQLPQCSVI